MKYYTKQIEDLASELGTNLNIGLTNEEADVRLNHYGFNRLREKSRAGFLEKLLAQLNDFLVIILIIASLFSFIIGEKSDSIVIIAIVIINSLIGIYQEGKAEKSLEALKELAAPNAKVVRHKTASSIPAERLVPGDIVLLEAGDIVAADIRLIESFNFKIEESALTGESMPVDKDANKILEANIAIGDRVNMAFASTIVTYGRARGLVVGTGHNTEVGRIASILQTYEDEDTPLQGKLNELGKYLGLITIIVSILVLFVGLAKGENWLYMTMVAISLAVAAIPEGLPAIVTIVLSLAMNRMVKKNALVKKLLAVETLGATSTICSDKTGTLTQNKMTVVKLYANGKTIDVREEVNEAHGNFKLKGNPLSLNDTRALDRILSAGILCNDSILEKDKDGFKILGDPTEGALMVLGDKGGLVNEELAEKYPRLAELAFDSNRKIMTTVHKNLPQAGFISFTKGAPDLIIENSISIFMDGKILPMTRDIKEELHYINSSFSKNALRVLALAFKPFHEAPVSIESELLEKNIVLLGLVGIIDPPRPEVKEAIKKSKSAGIKTVMITGDYKETAFAIAKELGIAESMDELLTGPELENTSASELMNLVTRKRVYARVSPEHKVRIIDALKANGEVIAMTGDGVNDALALKRADIGIAMGISGTDVAKNTSDLILTDDNFASIVSAVEEGRIIYSNIKKFVSFLLSCNIGEILIVSLSIFLGFGIPLIPIQLLWLNLVTDSFPALALGMEEGEFGIMDLPPRDTNEAILNKAMIKNISVQSITIAIASLSAYIWALKTYGQYNIIRPRTIIFATLVMAELLRAFSSRSTKLTIWELGLLSNKTLVYANIFSFILLLIVIYLPVLRPLFHTYPLSLGDWKAILFFSTIPLIISELYKMVIKKAQ